MLNSHYILVPLFLPAIWKRLGGAVVRSTSGSALYCTNTFAWQNFSLVYETSQVLKKNKRKRSPVSKNYAMKVNLVSDVCRYSSFERIQVVESGEREKCIPYNFYQ